LCSICLAAWNVIDMGAGSIAAAAAAGPSVALAPTAAPVTAKAECLLAHFQVLQSSHGAHLLVPTLKNNLH
ncbi:hypothetical protein HDU80_004594, partial [Chytriomyces hyalinus]